MSKSEVAGISLKKFVDPIITALHTYQDRSNGSLVFDADAAGNLTLTPDKTNSARSETDVLLTGELIGRLFVIAFKPGDGSGSEANRRLNDLTVDRSYPRVVQIVPRDKTGVYSEAHLTIVSHEIDDAHAEPMLFKGKFDLLGLRDKKVVKIGELGHQDTSPVSTFTVGYRNGKRFGDPHAVYSGISNAVQVCAFLALTEEMQKIHPDALNGLSPQFPTRA